MTTHTVEALLQAITDVRAQLHHSADLHICNRIMERARELAAAQPSASEPVDKLQQAILAIEDYRDEANERFEPAPVHVTEVCDEILARIKVYTFLQPSPQQAGESFAATRAQD